MKRLSKRISDQFRSRIHPANSRSSGNSSTYKSSYSSGSDESSNYRRRRQSCPVCQQRFDSDACMTQCGHKFCRSCIEIIISSPQKTCDVCNVEVSDYNTIWVETGKPLKERDVKTIFGTSFIQFGMIGLESYTFDRDRCFISYEPGVIPERWELSNGEKPPARKYFRDWSFDKTERRFVGTIDWSSSGSFRGRTRCEYEMIFDLGFDQIIGGKVVLYKEDGTTRDQVYGSDKLKHLRYRRLKTTIYGNSYIRLPSAEEAPEADAIVSNLGTLGAAGLGISASSVELMVMQELPLDNLCKYSLHFSKKRSYLDLANLPGPHPARVRFLNETFDHKTRTFIGQLNGKNCTNILPERSEWVLHFNETLERIESGKVKHFGHGGRVVKVVKLGWESNSAQRYLLKAPWQTTCSDEESSRFQELYKLLE